MGRGILSGLFWGSTISVLVLAAASLLAPLDPGVPETADEAVTAEPSGAAQTPVARLQEPSAETAPKPAAGPAGTDPDPQSADTEIAAGVDLPAGSEFRKALPETEANVPGAAALPDGPVPPAAPDRGTEDQVLNLPDGTAARRPATPGMSVTAPRAPVAEAESPSFGAVSGNGDGGMSQVSPAQPAAPNETADEVAPGADGLPPAVRAEVANEAQAAATVDAATPVAETTAPELAPAVDGSAPVTAALPDRTGAARPEAVPPTDAPDRRQPVVGVAGAPLPTAPGGTAPSVSPDSAAPVTTVVEAPSQGPGELLQPADPGTIPPAGNAGIAPSPDLSGADALPATAPERATAERGNADPATPPEVTSVAPRVPGGQELAPVPSDPADAVPSSDSGAEVIVGTGPGVAGRGAGGLNRPVRPLTERAGMQSRLPQIGGSDPAEAPAPISAATPEPKMGALTRNARAFANPDGKPLFSVILIDDGSGGLDRSVLTTLSFPVTFAIDPTRPDAAGAAAAYASAGFEVVALATGLPEQATGIDVSVAFESYAATVPQAVAFMDLATGGLAKDLELAEFALSAAAADGFGLVAWDRGLGPLENAARRGGAPVGLIYRELDAGNEKSPTIRRYLDRAAFKAAQDGSVILVGRGRAETVTALFEWARGGKAAQVALAPVSAVLRAK